MFALCSWYILKRKKFNIDRFILYLVYHLKCIDPWLTKNRRVCPVCKAKVILPGMAEDSETDSEQEHVASPSVLPNERTPLLDDSRNRNRRRNRSRRSSRTRSRNQRSNRLRDTQGGAGDLGIYFLNINLIDLK